MMMTDLTEEEEEEKRRQPKQKKTKKKKQQQKCLFLHLVAIFLFYLYVRVVFWMLLFFG
jgi:cell division septal protein FtsQ